MGLIRSCDVISTSWLGPDWMVEVGCSSTKACGSAGIAHFVSFSVLASCVKETAAVREVYTRL